MATMLSTDETVTCAACFFRRFFGFEAGEQTLAFIRRAAENGLTIAEFIAAVKSAVLVGENPKELLETFRWECREAWKRMQDPGS